MSAGINNHKYLWLNIPLTFYQWSQPWLWVGYQSTVNLAYMHNHECSMIIILIGKTSPYARHKACHGLVASGRISQNKLLKSG